MLSGILVFEFEWNNTAWNDVTVSIAQYPPFLTLAAILENCDGNDINNLFCYKYIKVDYFINSKVLALHNVKEIPFFQFFLAAILIFQGGYKFFLKQCMMTHICTKFGAFITIWTPANSVIYFQGGSALWYKLKIGQLQKMRLLL